MHRFDRRRALLFGLRGGLALRALATGLPLSFLSLPRRVRAQEAETSYLVLAISDRGDPLNANAPGSYVEGVVNNPLPELAPTTVRLGAMETRAARPWAELPETLRSRLAFFHFRTGVVTHPQMDEVLHLRGAVTSTEGAREEMLPSMLAAEAAPSLGTILRDPIPLGREGLSASGLPLDGISPAELKNLFATSLSGLDRLASLRDQAIDQIYADVRASGTRQQRTFLDRHVQSRDQARALGEQLSTLLERVSDNPMNEVEEARDQILAAVALFRLNVSPVVTIHIPFGADNHQDATLEDEAAAHLSGIGLIETLHQELTAAGLLDRTTFATLNVFGRTLLPNRAGGRDHNGNHHVMAAFGPRVRPGVYGALAREGNDFAAMAIDAETGRGVPDGNVPADETLLAAGRTLVRWMGLPDEVSERRLTGGRAVEAMVA